MSFRPGDRVRFTRTWIDKYPKHARAGLDQVAAIVQSVNAAAVSVTYEDSGAKAILPLDAVEWHDLQPTGPEEEPMPRRRKAAPAMTVTEERGVTTREEPLLPDQDPAADATWPAGDTPADSPYDDAEDADPDDSDQGDDPDGEEYDASPADPEATQPPLIPMSDDELRKAGKKLAKLVKDRVEMKAEHKAVREEQAADLKKLDAQIEAVASTIRSQGR